LHLYFYFFDLLMDSATFQKISRIGKVHETEAGPVSRHLNREDESASGAASQRRRPATPPLINKQ